MQSDETREGERNETLEELSNLLLVVQQMGHRLSYETHQEAYDLVLELNALLHQARTKLELLQKISD
jgi:hypothetical protein